MCDDSGVGGDGRSVGRTYPAFENAPDPQLLPMGAAQCANNSAYGSWYSLEPAGRCASPLPAARTVLILAVWSGLRWHT